MGLKRRNIKLIIFWSRSYH